MIEDGASFLSGRLWKPAATEAGHIEIVIENPWPGDEGAAGCVRGWIHLSDETFTASCLSIVSFFGEMHVRFYDQDRVLIESLKGDMRGWMPGETHIVRCEWGQGKTALVLDGRLQEERTLDRPLGGCFRQLHVGYHPAHWTAEATIRRLSLMLTDAK